MLAGITTAKTIDRIRFFLSVVFNFSPAKNVSKNNILVKSDNILINNFYIGQEVICIAQGKTDREDCAVGNRFIIRNIIPEHSWNGDLTGNDTLVFDCHPYNYKGRNCDSARSCRFQDYEKWIEEKELKYDSGRLQYTIK